MTGHLECYFQCGVLCSSLEDLAFHIELVHRETSDISPFVVRKSKEQSPPAFPGRAPPPIPLSSKEKVRVQQVTATKDGKAGSGDDDELDLSIICDGCGEHLVLLSDLDEHHEMHEAERLILNDGPSSSSQSNVINSAQEHSSSPSSFIPSNSRTITGANSPSFSTDLSPALRHEEHRTMHQQQSQRQSLGRKFLSMVGMERKSPGKPRRDTERLGKKELGPHAYEDRMPESLIKHLQKGPKVTRSKVISRSGGVVTREEVQGETIGVLPVLRRLIEYDPYVRIAYLCHPTVKQIGKDKYEGGFCGYRSIQMQVSYLQGCKAPGCEHFPGRTPSIFELQDQIETAWDNKIHWHSRSQIGVLKYTRKWIGTLEAHAIYQNLGIPCQVQQFSDTERQYAHEQLLDYVEEYFANVALMDGRKVQLSLKPPIYFQRPGHSMVIVGLEKMQNGVRNLLVFDPMYQAPKAMEQLVQRGERKIRAPDPKLLHFYRRSEYRLENYVDFECLELTGDNLPIFPAWDVIDRLHRHPVVYAFFDMSTFSYEVLPQEFFHDLFPWHCYGGLFDTEVGQFHRHSEGESSSRNIVLPSACVPILWSRRESLTRMTRRLTYDAWMLPRYYERFNHGYWDNDCAVWKEWRMDDELLPVMEIINIGLIFPPRELQRYCDRYEELRGYFEEPVEWEDQEEHEWH